MAQYVLIYSNSQVLYYNAGWVQVPGETGIANLTQSNFETYGMDIADLDNTKVQALPARTFKILGWDDGVDYDLNHIAVWKLDETTGTSVADSVGSFTGTAGSGATIVDGYSGKARSFDRTANASIGFSNQVIPLGAKTILQSDNK